MSARDTIAAALTSEPFGERDHPYHAAADAVIAAVRAMPVEDQAELIGGDVIGNANGATIIGPWREVAQ